MGAETNRVPLVAFSAVDASMRPRHDGRGNQYLRELAVPPNWMLQ